MKMILLGMAVLVTFAAGGLGDEEFPKGITEEIGLVLEHCHSDDSATIHVTPIPKNQQRVEGTFTTTNTLLTLRDLSMLPDGLNRLDIRTVCRGLTSAPSTMVIDLQRPPPKPRIGRRMLSAATNQVSAPPIPPGIFLALPGGATNHGTYQDLELMKRYFEGNKRRSQ